MPTKITIDPKHSRLQKFLAGKGVLETDKPSEVEVSDHELTSLMRKAKEGGFENLIKVPKSAVKKATKANEDRMESRAEIEEQEEASDETTADTTIPQAQAREEAEEEAEDSTPRRRRRS